MKRTLTNAEAYDTFETRLEAFEKWWAEKGAELFNDEQGLGAIAWLTDEADIKPCPFCGGKVDFHTEDGCVIYLQCDKCKYHSVTFEPYQEPQLVRAHNQLAKVVEEHLSALAKESEVNNGK